MSSSSTRKHLFISHHHKDDSLVDNFVQLLSGKGWDIRNSSIRANPANQKRIEAGQVKDTVIQRLLRMKISWASTVVVLIGKDTHSRPWVSWEIDQAHAQGKRIVGVFESGGKAADVPDSLEKYASSIVGWSSAGIVAAIQSHSNRFEDPDGSVRTPVSATARSNC